MAVAGPQITSATRNPTNPAWIDVTYTAPVSGYRAVQFHLAAGGNPRQATQTTTLNGRYTITSWGGSALPKPDTELRLYMTATHATEGPSTPGNTVTIAPYTVAAPNLTAAERIARTVAALTYTGVPAGATVYVKRRLLPSGTFAQVNAFTPSTSSGIFQQTQPDDQRSYEYHLTAGNFGVESQPSTARTVGPWWLRPAAPGLSPATRNASTGVVSIGWTASATGQRDVWQGVRVYRAFKGQAKPQNPWRTLAAGARSLTDTTTDLTKGYTYWVESYNAAGPSSSAPSTSVDAVRDLPNAATGLSITYLSGNRYQLDWSINATTERPVTSQRILGRVPGSTATTTLATAGGTTTQYDLDLGPNAIFELAVLTVNGVGQATSTSNWSEAAVSLPSNPASLGPATWQDPTTIRVPWARNASSIGDELVVEFSTLATPDRNNPDHWQPAPFSPVTNWRTVASTVHTSASQLVPHTYRARARHADSGRTATAWVYSARLDAQAAPNAPTMLMPQAIDATGSIRLRAQHNPVDGTPRTTGEIRFRQQGTPTWTTHTANSGTTVIPAGTFANGQVIEVQGRTAGASGIPGPWGHVTPGASLLVTLRARPTVTILYPTSGVVHEGQSLTVRWESSEQSSATVAIASDAGYGVEAVVGPEVREYTFDDLVDGHQYLGAVVVRDPWQASNLAAFQFTVDYNLPAPPTLTAEVRESDASVFLRATPMQGFRTTRTNLWASSDPWAAWSTSSPLGISRVTFADGSEGITVHSDGFDVANVAMPSSGHWLLSVDAAVISGDASALLATGWLPGAPGQAVEIFPDWSRILMHTASPAAEAHLLGDVGRQYGFRRALLTPWTAGAAPSAHDVAYFDGDTVDPDGLYTYGWNPDGTAWEAVPDPEGDREVAQTVRIEIWCSRDGVTYARCGDTATDWTHHDRHPAIGVPLWYKARAIAESGAWAESVPVQVVVESDSAWLHYGPDREFSVHGGWSPTITRAAGRNVVRKRYAGHDVDTLYHGPRKARSSQMQMTIVPGDHGSSADAWMDAAEHPGTVLYRSPAGEVIEGELSGVSWTGNHSMFQRVSFTVTEGR